MRLNSSQNAQILDQAGPGTEPYVPPKPAPKPITSFPMEIYPETLQRNFNELARHYSIPIDFLGVTGLFVISSLAGNMYRGQMHGGIKPILYTCMVGPSGVGKSPAYKILCDHIIAPLRTNAITRYKEELKAYNDRKIEAKAANTAFTDDPPSRRVRMITDGTLEAITKYAEMCPAGFGIVYDEGERFFTGANAYKKDTSSVGFWNELWNGSGYEILRVDTDRERHISETAVSVLIGMQRDRLLKFFNEDTISSGLLNRFLICESDYIELNEDADPFAPNMRANDGWVELVSSLFDMGLQYTADGGEIPVHFTPDGKDRMRVVAMNLTKRANVNIKESREGDESRLMIAYMSKLQAYVPRLATVLAIMDNRLRPAITHDHVDKALLLHEYFKETARRVMLNVAEGVSSGGLTEAERKVLNALPLSFTTAQAEQVCEDLGIAKSFFGMAFKRKFENKHVRKTARGQYEKS